MALFRNRETPVVAPPLSALERVKLAATAMERARDQRDAAIAAARREGSLREVADAAGLSVSRVKQISPPGVPHWAVSLSPVTDVDLFVADAPNRRVDDRVYALEEVDPWLPEWPSERAFLQENQVRAGGLNYDICNRANDIDPAGEWTVVYASGTREVYAFCTSGPLHISEPVDPKAKPAEEMSKGSPHGPCLLLGHVFNYSLVKEALNRPTLNMQHRPGGLVWIYSRIRTTNRIVRSLADPIDGAGRDVNPLWDYLESLPESERS